MMTSIPGVDSDNGFKNRAETLNKNVLVIYQMFNYHENVCHV